MHNGKFDPPPSKYKTVKDIENRAEHIITRREVELLFQILQKSAHPFWVSKYEKF